MGTADATVMIDTITTSNPADPFNTPNHLQSFNANGGTITDFLTPSSAASTNNATDFFWGAGQSAGDKPTSVLGALGTDLANGILNPNGSGGFGLLNVLFPQTIFELNGSDADVFIFNPDASTAEVWLIRAIVGGDASNPTTGGNQIVFTGAGFGGTGISGSHQRDSGGDFTQQVVGIGISVDEFSVDRLIGLQIQTPVPGQGDQSNGGDPSVIVALRTIPEPTSLAVWSLISAVGVAAGWRRARQARKIA